MPSQTHFDTLDVKFSTLFHEQQTGSQTGWPDTGCRKNRLPGGLLISFLQIALQNRRVLTQDVAFESRFEFVVFALRFGYSLMDVGTGSIIFCSAVKASRTLVEAVRCCETPESQGHTEKSPKQARFRKNFVHCCSRK